MAVLTSSTTLRQNMKTNLQRIGSPALLFIALGLFLVACETAPEPLVVEEVREPSVITLGEALTEESIQDFYVNDSVEFEGESITLLSIQDSRCPKEVACYWPGFIRLVFEHKNMDGSSKTLNWTLANSNDAVMEYSYEGEEAKTIGSFFMQDFGLQVIGLEPYPGDGQSLAQTDYVVALLLHRRNETD